MGKQTGNMYTWIDETINPITGRCPHQCIYCYMTKGKMKLVSSQALHLSENQFQCIRGKEKVIFIGSSTDAFAEEVPGEWIERVLERCREYDNTYLFQTKNPGRFKNFIFPEKTILGTTIETNRDYGITLAPSPYERYVEMVELQGYQKMVSVEPVFDFDLDVLVGWLKEIDPSFISIGADSKYCNLPEPSREKVNELMDALEPMEIRIKSNLERLI
jgi:DNA repair photolyase